MAGLPECISCGVYVHSGPVLCERCYHADALMRDSKPLAETRPMRVASVEHLMQLAYKRRAVSYGPGCRRIPAAFAINMQASCLVRMIQNGMYVWEPKKAKKETTR